jgi:hypothetical protein
MGVISGAWAKSWFSEATCSGIDATAGYSTCYLLIVVACLVLIRPTEVCGLPVLDRRSLIIV